MRGHGRGWSASQKHLFVVGEHIFSDSQWLFLVLSSGITPGSEMGSAECKTIALTAMLPLLLQFLLSHQWLAGTGRAVLYGHGEAASFLFFQ